MTDLRTQLQDTLGSAYTIDRELGGGGMSRVFVAEETALARRVVVKVLPPDIGAGVNAERFRREIQLSAKLQHPHIVPVLTTGEMNGVPYYTMPFVEGESLRSRLQQSGALPITEAVGILRDVANALAYAHEHGIAHRDIKPDNILLSGRSAAVADFGIAKAITAAKDSGDGATPTLTQVGTSLGTPAYMAPEQAAADPATNHRADIYAFGCVAYEVLAGRPPFIEKSPQKLLTAQMSDRPQPIAELRPDTPAALAELVMQCLEKDADARPQDAMDLVRVLETVTSGGGHAAMPAILLGGGKAFQRALLLYAAAFLGVLVLTQAAILAVGLPDWVMAGAVIVMLLGLPVILFTGYAQRVARRAVTMTPTFTPGGTPATRHGTMATIAMKASPHLSWDRAAKGGVYALAGFVVLVGAFMAMRAAGIGPAGSLLGAGKLKDKERIIVTEFQSPDTGLSTLVTEAVRTSLAESRVISIMPPVAVNAALQRMQRPVTSRLDLALAREIAQREGAKAIVDGTVRPLGAGYVVSLRLVGADSSNELAVMQATAASPGELLEIIDDVTKKLRGRIGESLKSVRGSAPLEQVTTASLEALRIYAEGARTLDRGGSPAVAAQQLREAVRVDTAFAMAWRKLGAALSNMGAPGDSVDSAFARAYRLRGRLTERERLFAEATYFQMGPGRDRRRAVQAYDRLIQLDPAGGAANNLANILMGRREFVRAESIYTSLIVNGPATSQQYANLFNALFNQGKVEAADSIGAEIRERFPRLMNGRRALNTVLYHRGRLDSLEASFQSQLRSDDVNWRLDGAAGLEDLSFLRGRVRDAERFRQERIRVAQTLGQPGPRPINDSLFASWRDLLFHEDTAAAVRRMDATLRSGAWRDLEARRRPYFDLISFHSLTGRPQVARALLAEWEGGADSTMRRVMEPARLGALSNIAIAERRYPDAVRFAWRSDSTYDGPAGSCAPCILRGVAYTWDAAGNADSTIHYMERYLATPNTAKLDLDALDRPMMLKRLGELYEARGDVANAAKRYREFIALWERADPPLQPRVAEARRRLSRLADTETPTSR